MDFIKKAAAAASSGDKNNSSSSNTEAQQPPPQQQPGGETNPDQKPAEQSGAQKQDYGDKAFDFISKKAGINLSPDNQEKVTDGARSAYEKYSGKTVDAKYSN
ncbi:hypothetical protein E4U41_004644 [Claviceps citrina]|nr:hypothetical protein E4U41_004644 [Claviceps citrina]